MNEDELWHAIYLIGAVIHWVVIFVGLWIYAIASYGYLLGVGLGWLPAGIIASMACWLWPLPYAAAAYYWFFT